MKKIKFTQKQFIDNCKKVHGNRYDYSKSVYIDCFTPVIIICKEHGEFKQAPLKHYNKKQGCPYCAGNIKLTNEKIINQFKHVHGNKYDYSKVNYININTKVEIICKKHGSFYQSPKHHKKGFGCARCSGNKKKTTEEFIKESTKIHNNKYDYCKTRYDGAFKKVIIICKEHGEFLQKAKSHLNGHGCPKCKTSKGEIKIINFLEKNNIDYEYNKIFEKYKKIKKYKFDFYIPKYNICIKFDGRQHFEPINFWGGEKGLKETQKRDKIKNDFCVKNNIKMIRIKYNQNIEKKLNNIFSLL